MPKVVDHEQRKKQIAEATWRVILNEGMKGATVRNIAQEAGLSLGALRHYFSTQDELLSFAMNLVKERATERVQRIVMCDLPVKEKVLNILLELLPVDEQKMVEMEVWFAFVFYKRNRTDRVEPQDDGIYPALCNLINHLDKQQLLREGLDKELELEKLYALLDGIALHALLDPGRLNKERIVEMIKHQLDSICVE